MKQYIVLYGGADVTYPDGTEGNDMVVLGTVTAESKADALDGVADISPISAEEIQRGFTSVRELAEE